MIERALQEAIDSIAGDFFVEAVVRCNGLELDKDTKGVPGSPPIFDTILAKIDRAAVFVPDLTFIGTDAGRYVSNPNFLIEYGWALKALGYSRIIPVMNAAHGKPSKDSMPFDMAHLLFPITYDLPDLAPDSKCRAVQEQLTRDLEAALRTVLESQEFKSTLPTPIKPEAFARKKPLYGKARFRERGEPLGLEDNPFYSLMKQQPAKIFLSEGAATYLRVMPAYALGPTWSISELAAKIAPLCVMPLTSPGAGSSGHVREKDGYGCYPAMDSKTVPAVSFIFETGEIWCISVVNDALSMERKIPFYESRFVSSLQHCADFLSKLGISGPFTWIAGIEAAEQWALYSDRYNGAIGHCLNPQIELDGIYSDEDSAEDALRPFFRKVYDQFRCTFGSHGVRDISFTSTNTTRSSVPI